MFRVAEPGEKRTLLIGRSSILAEFAMSVQPPLFVSRTQASPNTVRARAKRDMTVPIGKAVTSEIWQQESSSSSRKTSISKGEASHQPA
jgi:hypothetical protein